MIKNFRKISIFLFLVTITLVSCREEEVYPVEPNIEYLSFYKINNGTGVDDKGVLRFFFTDGDGDIGILDGETQMDNLFFNFYEKQLGTFVKIDLTDPYGESMPYITPNGKNRSISGIVEDTIYINYPYSSYDTIRIDFYIIDRAGHKSNIASTPEIIVNK